VFILNNHKGHQSSYLLSRRIYLPFYYVFYWWPSWHRILTLSIVNMLKSRNTSSCWTDHTLQSNLYTIHL